MSDTEQQCDKLTAAPIQFYCDPGIENGRVIPLGYIAEITAGHINGFAMIARAKLSDEEREAIGELGRRVLDDPFDYLSSRFDDAWEHAGVGQRLQRLAEQHSQSLQFGDPEEMEVPRILFVEGSPNRLVRDLLFGVLEEGTKNLSIPAATAATPQQQLLALKAA